jgi:hypothetical protein
MFFHPFALCTVREWYTAAWAKPAYSQILNDFKAAVLGLLLPSFNCLHSPLAVGTGVSSWCSI